MNELTFKRKWFKNIIKKKNFFLDFSEGPTQASDFGFTAEQPFALPDLHIDGNPINPIDDRSNKTIFFFFQIFAVKLVCLLHIEKIH